MGTIRLPNSLHDSLRAYCKKNDKTMSKYVERTLTESLVSHKTQKDSIDTAIDKLTKKDTNESDSINISPKEFGAIIDGAGDAGDVGETVIGDELDVTNILSNSEVEL